jgi:16S rRNA G966 N2-methylase RsmD
MKLYFHPYKYYPYERQLALREVESLLGPGLKEVTNGVEVTTTSELKDANRLVYFSKIHRGRIITETIQARLERAGSVAKSRQATRYSVHGLHDYKGKFNPQVAKAILNMFGVAEGDRVLDPFCGSGTTLVECSHMGVESTGIDINPLAVFIANAKLQALRTPAAALEKAISRIERKLKRAKTNASKRALDDDRGRYLGSWFREDILLRIEFVRGCIENSEPDVAPIMLSIASNLLRDFSLQDPNDLRIRRRTSPLPSEPFEEVFLDSCRGFSSKLAEAQAVFGRSLPLGTACTGSVSHADFGRGLPLFDAAVTSPPYAMALPYIDTQRLSLVWLGLIGADRILRLEAELIGSREMRGAARRELSLRLLDNLKEIPSEQFKYCLALQSKLGASDGFRRKAVPPLLYRYFSEMQDAFRNIRIRMKKGAPFALIVGHNHTVLGGVRQDIDTPRHLSSLATHSGWLLEDQIELQTYRRYGYHATNAVSAETLLLLRAI